MATYKQTALDNNYVHLVYIYIVMSSYTFFFRLQLRNRKVYFHIGSQIILSIKYIPVGIH